MENENSVKYYQDYTEYKYVTRKRKSRKNHKSKQSTTVRINDDDVTNESDSSNPLESTIILKDENKSDEAADSVTPDYSEKYWTKSDRVSVDAMAYNPPKIVDSPDDTTSEQFDQTATNKLEDDEVKFNSRPLSKYASTYELEKFEKNVLIIFNHKEVVGEDPRLGTEKDVDALTNTFANYAFEVVEHKDLTKDEIFKALDIFSKRNFTDYGCIGIAVLTHGSHHGLLRAKDQEYSETDIINYLKVQDNPSLITKPKFLIIQACRGSATMQGAAVFQSNKIQEDRDESLEHYVLPLEADMLVLHSSYIGKSSHRDKFEGSWFIQSLCKKIDQLAATNDLESIFTEVKQEVAIDKYDEEYNSNTREMDINKQMPVMSSTLVRKLYLKKFGDATPLVTSPDNENNNLSPTNDMLNEDSPSTPSLLQFGPCSCFLNHFDYIRNCLRCFLQENPDDDVAQTYLVLANTYEEGTEFNNSKEKMAKIICTHLRHKARSCQYYNYLYFYKH